jgi:hypothetical protein
MATTNYSVRGTGTNIRIPKLSLRIGRGACRFSDLETARESSRNRWEARFNVGAGRRGKILHLYISNRRAGEPWGFIEAVAEVIAQGTTRSGQEAT